MAVSIVIYDGEVFDYAAAFDLLFFHPRATGR